MNKQQFPSCCGAYIFKDFPRDHTGTRGKNTIRPWVKKMVTAKFKWYVVTLNRKEQNAYEELKSMGFKFTRMRRNSTGTAVRVGTAYGEDILNKIGQLEDSRGVF